MLTKLKLLLNITDSSQDNLLNLLLELAIDKALRTLYPFEATDDKILPVKYNYWVIEASKQMYQALGSEQIKSYSENGLSITYADMESGISVSLLNELVPFGKALG